MRGEGVNRDSGQTVFLGTEGSSFSRPTGWQEEEKRDELQQMKKTTTWSRAAWAAPHTNTDGSGSHFLARIGPSEGSHCDFTVTNPPRIASHFPSIWSLSFYLALLMWSFQSFSISPHTSTHRFIFTVCQSQFDDHICINVIAVGLCLSGRSCAGIFSTRKQPWLWI